MTSPQTTPKACTTPGQISPQPVVILLHPSLSLSPLKQGTSPRPILSGGDTLLSEIATSQISSLTHTIRPSPNHSFQPSRQSTIKCLEPYDLSCPLSLTDLTLNHHLIPSSLGTAKPRSQLYLDLERIKVDELDFEVCFWCREIKDQPEVRLKQISGWGLQWVCKGRCGGEAANSEKESEAGEEYDVAGDGGL